MTLACILPLRIEVRDHKLETYQFLKETYQILNGALIGPYRALAPSAASPGELILAKIVVSVKYPVILRIETGKMISVA